ncbi:heavy-metal-associated domain-containing protein [Gilvibacter sediminis]|uniref:heavy-metal-associated domain-containing protein n=1 Tax=Gilvibacter sediminis TaxID=379071 RepID=UPI00235042B8|nr:cation transporter [Gilvibacter sediminis]MDC7997425.1 ATPase [Gilvibacter sediminis]
MKKLLIVLAIMSVGTTFAQNKNAKANIEVDGVCGMCKMRIEKAAVETIGVKRAVWNLETHELSLIFNEKKTSVDAIEKNIAAVGHDTPNHKATDAAYDAIDMCCKYRDPSVVDDHKNMKGDGGKR